MLSKHIASIIMNISLIFPYASALPNFIAGMGKAKSIPDKLDLKAYLVGYQTAALDAEKRRFAQERAQAQQEYLTALLQLLQLMAAQQRGGVPASAGINPAQQGMTPQQAGAFLPSGQQIPRLDTVGMALAASPEGSVPLNTITS